MMKCNNCGMETDQSVLCKDCWKIAVEIADLQNKKKLEKLMTKTDLQKLCAVLEELRIPYRVVVSGDLTVIKWDESANWGDCTWLYLKFDKDGGLIK